MESCAVSDKSRRALASAGERRRAPASAGDSDLHRLNIPQPATTRYDPLRPATKGTQTFKLASVMAVVHLFAVGDMHFLKNDFADLALDLCVLSHPYGEGTR